MSQSFSITVSGEELEDVIRRLSWLADKDFSLTENYYKDSVKFIFHGKERGYSLEVVACSSGAYLSTRLLYSTEIPNFMPYLHEKGILKFPSSFVVSRASKIAGDNAYETELTFDIKNEYKCLSFNAGNASVRWQKRHLLMPNDMFPKFHVLDNKNSEAPSEAEYIGYAKDENFIREVATFLSQELGSGGIPEEVKHNIKNLFASPNIRSRVLIRRHYQYRKVTVYNVDPTRTSEYDYWLFSSEAPIGIEQPVSQLFLCIRYAGLQGKELVPGHDYPQE